MRNKDFISGVFWLGIGLIIIWQALDLKLGNYRTPGPGFLPLGVGLGMVGLSLAIIVRTLLSPSRPGETVRVSTSTFKRLSFVMATLLVCAVLFPHLGFPLTTLLLLMALFKGVEPQSWPKSLLWAGSATIFIYLLFSVLLSVELPRGILGI